MTTREFGFQINNILGKARTGIISTAHGEIHTPAFMPVGTVGSVKAMTTDAINQTGAEIILGNTYHLMLRPTAERIYELGGLHKFMNWNKPILTDSGGFQVMSLAKLRTISEQGVVFKSYLDGKQHMLSPERSMEIQYFLDSNITMIFDECTQFPIEHKEAELSMKLSLRWAERSKLAFKERKGYGLFGIVQGSVYKDLRLISAKELHNIGFDGYAVGGMTETQQALYEVLDYTIPNLPEDKPHYVMGIGKPSDIIGSVIRGVDMFDCVIPTRSGRNGQAFVRSGTINIRNSKYSTDLRPLDELCKCPACINHSRAYLNHLVKTKEILGSILMTWHNLTFYQDLMAKIRESINIGDWSILEEWLGYSIKDMVGC
ncbi:Queuine tRNA-ribosyltransferase [Rickettsiales bacterium Ac37b]|nr:Queuine tRNA-ribosyltransferase [Rickettsiales bacterium Ac37b]